MILCNIEFWQFRGDSEIRLERFFNATDSSTDTRN